MTYRILVCDDDREIARAICIYLRSTGYEAVEAHDGTEVLELCRTQTFHLLILGHHDAGFGRHPDDGNSAPHAQHSGHHAVGKERGHRQNRRSDRRRG